MPQVLQHASTRTVACSLPLVTSCLMIKVRRKHMRKVRRLKRIAFAPSKGRNCGTGISHCRGTNDSTGRQTAATNQDGIRRLSTVWAELDVDLKLSDRSLHPQNYILH